MKVVAGHGAAGLGHSLHLVNMLTVLLISSIITLGVEVTMKMFRQAGLFLLNQAGEVGGRTRSITWHGQDIIASVFAGLTQEPSITFRVVTLARVIRIASSSIIRPCCARMFQPECVV